MKKNENKNGLNILHPTPRPASREWCHRLRLTGLESALKSAAEAKLNAADVSNLMKIRRTLVEQLHEERQVVWQDPPHWHPKQPDLAA